MLGPVSHLHRASSRARRFRVADRDEDQMVGYDEFVRVLEITRQR